MVMVSRCKISNNAGGENFRIIIIEAPAHVIQFNIAFRPKQCDNGKNKTVLSSGVIS